MSDANPKPKKRKSPFSKALPTLVALALLGGGSWYVYKYESGEMTDREKAESVLVQDKYAICKVVLQSKTEKGESSITFETPKDKTDWKITAPLKTAPDSMKMDDLLGKLAKLDSKRLVADKVDKLDPYGLDKPQTTVEYTTIDAKDKTKTRTEKIFVGSKSAVENSFYVKRSDSDKLFLVDSYVVQIFQDDLNKYRDRKIIKVESEKATLVKMVGPTETRTFKRGEKDAWNVESPVAMRANAQTIKNMLSALDNLRVDEFENDAPKPGDLARYGLDKPKHTITITFEKDEGTRTLLVGSTKEGDSGKTYVKRDTAENVYTVSSSSLIDLTKPLEDFKDQKLFDFAATKLKKLTIEHGSRKAVAERDAKGNWSFVQPQIRKEAHTLASILATALENLRARSFVKEDKAKAADYKLDPPDAKITFEGEKIPATTIVAGRASADKGRHLRIGTDPFLAITEDDPVPKAITLVNAYMAVVELAQEKVDSLKIAKGSESIDLKKDDKGAWIVDKPKGAVLMDPAGKVAAILDALAGLGADELAQGSPSVTEQFHLTQPEYRLEIGGKGQPALTVEVSTASGQRRAVKTSADARIGLTSSAGDLVKKLGDALTPVVKQPSPAPSVKPLAPLSGSPSASVRPPPPPVPSIAPPAPSPASAKPGASLPILELTPPKTGPSPGK